MPPVYGGSTARIAGSIQSYDKSGNKGITLLAAVQIVDLAEQQAVLISRQLRAVHLSPPTTTAKLAMVRTTISEVLKKRFRSGLKRPLPSKSQPLTCPSTTRLPPFNMNGRQGNRVHRRLRYLSPDGQTIFIEAKGILTYRADKKCCWSKLKPLDGHQFIFSNSRAPLYKAAKRLTAIGPQNTDFCGQIMNTDDWLNPKIGEDDVPEQTDLGSPDEGGVDQLS